MDMLVSFAQNMLQHKRNVFGYCILPVFWLYLLMKTLVNELDLAFENINAPLKIFELLPELAFLRLEQSFALGEGEFTFAEEPGVALELSLAEAGLAEIEDGTNMIKLPFREQALTATATANMGHEPGIAKVANCTLRYLQSRAGLGDAIGGIVFFFHDFSLVLS